LFQQESMYYLTGYDTFGFCFFQCLYLWADGTMALLTRSADLRKAQHTSTIEDIRIWTDAAGASTACRRSSSDQRRLVSITTILSLEICPDIGTEPIGGRHNHRLNKVSSISSARTKQGGRHRTLTIKMSLQYSPTIPIRLFVQTTYTQGSVSIRASDQDKGVVNLS
jgi:hypothetical protein